jgi:hypothetical protein
MTYFWHAYAYADVAVRKPALLLMAYGEEQIAGKEKPADVSW